MMKLDKTLPLALGAAHAHASHKVMKSAVDVDITRSLLVKASTASVVKMPEAVAMLFDQSAGDEVPAKTSSGPVEQHADSHGSGLAANIVNIFYLGVGGSPSTFALIDKSGEEHRYAIEEGTYVQYDNAVYEHRVDAPPDSKRTMLGPASLPLGGRRLEAVGGSSNYPCTACCTGSEGDCEVEGCPAAEGVQLGIGVTTPGSVPVGTQCWACDYTNGIKPDRFNIVDINYQSTADAELACVEQYFTGSTRRNLRDGGRKTLFGSYKTPANGCCNPPSPI
jgi:uncharacterized protein YcnI